MKWDKRHEKLLSVTLPGTKLSVTAYLKKSCRLIPASKNNAAVNKTHDNTPKENRIAELLSRRNDEITIATIPKKAENLKPNPRPAIKPLIKNSLFFFEVRL